MAKEEKNSAQNIDGVLRQLKESYSTDTDENTAAPIEDESVAEEVSGDELQARLRSRFLSDDAQSTEDAAEDYLIDEDFLRDVSADDVDDLTENEEYSKESIYELDDDLDEEDYREFDKEIGEKEAEEEAEENAEDGVENMEVESYSEGYKEIQEVYEEGEEILTSGGLETLAEEANEDEKDSEASEQNDEDIPLKNSDGVYFEDDEDYSLWREEESYTPIELDDADNYDDESDAPITAEDITGYDEDEPSFEIAEDTRTPAEISEDNYVDVFYRDNEYDPYENMSFKERISEGAPTVDSLEAELDGEPEDFSLEEFDEAESMPLSIDDADVSPADVDEVVTDSKTSSPIADLDNSDLALLLEFGYTEEVLENVPDEIIDNILVDESVYGIDEDSNNGSDVKKTDDDTDVLTNDAEQEDSSAHFQRSKQKLTKQYGAYRKKRGGILFRLIISAALTLVLFLYELIPLFSDELGGLFNREEYFFAYALVGLQILIFAFIPAIKSIYESFKKVLLQGINAYFIAGAFAAITVIYDFIVVFVRGEGEVPPTFHFCVALILIMAELSELMKLSAEIKNYEYYFSEYLFDGEMTEVENFKYTLVKSEGRGSIAEKMYVGGLDAKTVVYAPQSLETTSGFFESSKKKSKKNKVTFSWIIASAVVALISTIVSGIIYDSVWIAASAFILTLNLMMPIIAIIIEWLPFEKLSSQNYYYGAAFASEGALEDIEKCDMLVFNDLHMFEPCDAKSVNLAIYDSTSRSVLLSCLNSVYSEIGGPLRSAFASVNVRPIGKCKINRVARSGVEAVVGSSYSVLIGDEQFMSRYGIFFPKAALGKEEDKIFTLCVAINNRATARIAVKYKINDTFYSILQKLQEDKISCVVQTYDPMISAELVARVRPYKGAPVNIVHKNSADYTLEKHSHKTGALYSVMNSELPVFARGSRLNLAVALSNAKKMRKLRTLLNICSGALISVGAILSFAVVLSEKLMSVNWLFVFIYWIVSAAVMIGLFIWKFPQKDRFIFNKK